MLIQFISEELYFRGWIGDAVNIYCSSRGPKFSSQNQYYTIHNWLQLQLQGSDTSYPLQAPVIGL